MVSFIGYLLIWIFCLYGMFCILHDYVSFHTYRKIEENIKMVITVKNVENGIEEYIREITCGRNFYHQLVVIDRGSQDDTLSILKKLEKEKYNMKVLEEEEGIQYIQNII